MWSHLFNLVFYIYDKSKTSLVWIVYYYIKTILIDIFHTHLTLWSVIARYFT